MPAAAGLTRAAAHLLLLAGLLLGLLVAAPSPSSASSASSASATDTCEGTWFGPALDIETDTPSAYAGRLGASPSLYTFPVDYPLTEEGVDQLGTFAADAATHGAVLVVQVEPTVPLGRLDAAEADELAAVVGDLHDRLDTRTDSEIDLSASRETAALDSNGNGRFDPADDPYGPYYPGDDAVDWVGLFLYRFGQSQGVRRNVRPPADEAASRLAEQWGYPTTGRTSFYDRFAEAYDKPVLLETAALYNPGVGGAGELALKQRWWREVLAALPTHPRICAISWLELDRVEPEVADQPVDWEAARTPALARALLADLRTSRVALGPVTDVHAASETSPSAAPSPTGPPVTDRPPAVALLPAVVPGPAGETGARAAAVALVALLLLGLLGSRRRSWRYAEEGGRDRRLDALRGLLLLGMVAWHLPTPGPLHDLADRAGSLAGLETFVLASGAAAGLVYPPLATQLGHTAALGRRWRRALLTWLGALAGVLAVYVLGLLPGLDLDRVGTVGSTYDLYEQARHLFDYPPPGSVGREFLFLEMGTWLLVPLALFVALVGLSPLAAGPLQRGLWWAVLPASWAVYAVGRLSGAEVLPSLSEEVAPLLVWQVLFVHGIALTRHRDEVTAFLARRPGVAATVVAVLAAAGVLWSGSAPSGADPDLPLARLLVIGAGVLVALTVLTTCWRPVAAVGGAVLEPLGRVPLLVVLTHTVLVLVVASVSALAAGPWTGTAVTVVSAGVLLLLARWRSPDPARARARASVPA